MEKIISDDKNITDELSLSKPEDAEGNEQGEKIIQEDVASAEAKDEIAQESFDITNSSLLEIYKHVSSQSNANGTKDPVGAPKELEISETATQGENSVQESTADVSATDDNPPEPPSECVISTNGRESPLEAPKEPVISEIVAEEVKCVVESSEVPGEDSSNVVKDDNPVEQVPETVAQEASEATVVTTTGAAEKPVDEEVTADIVELPHSGATELTEWPVNEVREIAQSESSDIVPTEPKQVQIETIVAELPSQKIDEERHAESDTQVISEPEGKTVVVSSDDTPTGEVVEGIAEAETEAKKKDQENNIDDDKTTLTETSQSIAEGVEVSEDAENENLPVQNPNLVELSRDIKMVGAETDVPSDNQLETESKPNTQTLLDKFANENTEEKKQETAQVDTGILTETNKDGDSTKAELSGKKSKNIMSKVKQSIVKVKKALIGKSPSSKTMVPEGIDGTKAK